MDSVLTVPEKEKRIDLLNRQEFVDDLFIIADALSRNGELYYQVQQLTE